MKRVMKSHLTVFCLLSFLFIVFGALGTPPGLLAATDEEVADAVAAGQAYLFNAFVDAGNGTGYWPDYTNLAGTCAAVAALIETGKMEDPAYADKIQKGIEYIKQFVQEDGSINYGNRMYETGMALVALSLYGREQTQGPDYDQMVLDAVDYLKSAQNLDDTSEAYGGWYYFHESRDGDLSNTQFAVMGIWYASRYLGLPIQGTEWANALFEFLENTQSTHDGTSEEGGFSYYPNTTSFLGGSMTGAGLWCLAMIGQGNNPMVAKAVNWFDQNYSWDRNPGTYYDNAPNDAYYYFVYGMAKGLTATIGPDGMVGTHEWSEDLKTQLVANQDPAGYWYRGGWLDPGQVICTSWVLMSLAFADPSTGSSEAFLPDLDPRTYPIAGLVILQVGGGATISNAMRLNIDPADNPEEKNFPIGGFDFLINNSGSATTVMTVTPPVELWNSNNPYSFVKPDGSTKDDVEWFTQSSPWTAADVALEIDREAQVIRVTLEDGGPGDTDGEVNGQIAGPGTPGNEMPSTEVPFDSPVQQGGTSQSDYRMASVPLNAVSGGSLAQAIDTGVPSGWTYGADGDIRVFAWNAETQDYEEIFGDDSGTLVEPTTYDMAGLAFWRIALETHSYEYMGTQLDPGTLPVDPGTELPYFEIMLKAGWNQFGFPFNDIDSVDVSDLLIGVDGVDFTPVTDEGNTLSRQTIWEFEDTDEDGNVNDVAGDGTDYDAAAFINKGFGYWLYVNAIPEPYTEVALRILYAPANGKSNASSFSTIMSVDEYEPTPPDPPAPVATGDINRQGSGGGGSMSCFIATAAYGSALHPHVDVLRQYRDLYLLSHEPGKKFVDFYYRHGPEWAEVIAAHPALKSLTRALLLPLIGYSAFMVYGGFMVKLSVMLALIFVAGCVLWRGRTRRYH